MNLAYKVEILSKLDPLIVENGLKIREKKIRMSEQEKTKSILLKIRWIAGSAACLLVLFSTIFLIHFFSNSSRETTYHSLNELKPYIVNAEQSRASVLSPLPPSNECSEREMTQAEFEELFSSSQQFEMQEWSFSGNIIQYSSGAIHTIRLYWTKGDCRISVIIDPVAYPQFVFDQAESTTEINGYTISIIQFLQNGAIQGTDIGMRKNDLGVLLSCNDPNEKDLEKIYNLILNSDLDIQNTGC